MRASGKPASIMRTGASVVGLLLGLTFAGSALADYAIKDGTGTPQIIKAFACSGGAAICPGYVPMDMTGAAFGVSGNPLVVTLSPTSPGITPLGQTTKANSQPVTIASDQGTLGNVGADPSSGKGTPSSVPINISTATTTQLVAASGSAAIYVTSYDVVAGGTGNFTLEYGAGSNCGTGTTPLTGPYPLTAQSGIAKGSGIAAILKVPAGNALCALTSAAVQMSGSLSYQQF